MNRKVLIVDDSLVIRRFMTKIVNEFKGYEVVGSASNGVSGVTMLSNVSPDMVIMDIEMPIMDGLNALPKMLEIKKNLPVLISSSLTQRNADVSLKALKEGAYDYIHKPSSVDEGSTAIEDFKKNLKLKLDAAFVVKDVARHQSEIESTVFPKYPANFNPKLILIGASTGGPSALLNILKSFKEQKIVTPILIAQHMPPVFTTSFAKQIERESGYKTYEAESGMIIQNNSVYLAPGDYHMVPSQDNSMKISLNQTSKVNFCRPSVDVMFNAYTGSFREKELLSIVLTGMGNDGANGAVTMIGKNNVVIVQDEQSSVVWGMPGAVVKKKACQTVLPLKDIPDIVKELVKGQTLSKLVSEKVMV